MATRGVWLALVVVALPAVGAAAERDLTELSLEELMNIEVRLVSRAPERRAESAAAVAVVTRDDVRRSGATSIPEALRLAPGLHVARVTTSGWVVASRGFSSINSAKLLVLQDGRSVYTPLFSGVFWDAQDVLLEDLDRIEVIRGPGASLWGANAVNGVINVVTRSARDTHGLFVEGGGGTEERGFGAVRWGGKLGDGFHYRVYGKYFDRDALVDAGPSHDDWRMGRAGFRADWDAGPDDVLTFQGDVYRGDVGQIRPSLILSGRPPPVGQMTADIAGGHVLARWRRALGDRSDVEVQAYYDRTERDDPTFHDDLDTFDVDVQHRFPLAGGHDVMWGLSYRLMSDLFHSPVIGFRHARSRDQLVSGFVQDHWTVIDQLRLTAGVKLEHNDFSGFEVQPTGRFAWDPHPGQTLWGAISRAVRVPTRIERDVFARASAEGADPEVFLLGDTELRAEELVAYELGYRIQVAPPVFVDVAGFYHRYDRLITFEIDETTTTDDGRTRIDVINENKMHGDSRGAEVAVHWQPDPRWRLMAWYAYVTLDLERDPGGIDVNRARRFEGATPHNQVHLRSFLDLPHGFELDLTWRWVDNVASSAESEAGPSPSYFNLDARLAWVRDGLELAVVGQNLLEDEHQEFPGGAHVDRGVYGKVAWRFR